MLQKGVDQWATDNSNKHTYADEYDYLFLQQQQHKCITIKTVHSLTHRHMYWLLTVLGDCKQQPHNVVHWKTITTNNILHPLHRSTCVSWHPSLRTGGFCWSKLFVACMSLLSVTSAFGIGKDARVLLKNITYTASILCKNSSGDEIANVNFLRRYRSM